MAEHELPPADQEQKTPPADQEIAPDSKLWPKEIRDAYLRMANRFDQTKKELESRISELQKQLEERDKLIAQLAQQYSQYGQYGQWSVDQPATYPYQLPQAPTGPTSQGVSPPPSSQQEEFDPLDPNSVRSFVDRKINEALMRLGQAYYQDQLARIYYTNMALEKALEWASQLSYLYRIDPDLSPQEVKKIVEHAAKSNQPDLMAAYRDVFKDKIAQREQERIREEIQRKLEEELKAQRAAQTVMGPPTGPIPRSATVPSSRPTSFQEATLQALQEYGGKIITPE